MRVKNKVVVWAFAWFWRSRLEVGDAVVTVKGWRSALIDERGGQRKNVTFMFKVIGRWI